MGNLIHASDSGNNPALLGSIYLLDLTDLFRLRDEYIASRPIVAVILVDNYDELTNNLPDNIVSTLIASIDTRLNEWTEGRGGILRRVERNRYFYIFEDRYLSDRWHRSSQFWRAPARHDAQRRLRHTLHRHR